MSDDLFESRSKPQNSFTRYNREERLKSASEKVKQMHNPHFIQKKSLIKSLTANRGLRAVFFSIIVLVVLNLILFAMFRDKTNGKIYGIKTELQSFVYNKTPLASVRLFSKLQSSVSADLDLTEGETVKVQFVFFDEKEKVVSSSIQTGIYTGAELKFSVSDEGDTAKKINATILIKEKLLQLSKKINE